MPSYNINQFSPAYGGMIGSDGEVTNAADVVAKFESLVSIKNIVAITTSNTVLLADATKGIYLGTAGDIKIDTVGGQIGVTLKGLAAGIWHPVQATKIYATGTTALDILGSW